MNPTLPQNQGTSAPTGVQTITASDGTQLDAGVVNLSRAIRQQESGGNYDAIGDAGTSHGAYQWQPGNFASAAQKYGLNPSDFSPVNQDKVAYHQIQDFKNQGYSPEQIASLWNSGKPDASGNVGDRTINGKLVHYDTPAYVQNVINNFQQYKNEMNGGVQQPPQESPSLGGFLGNVVQSGANFLGNLGEAAIHPVRTIQTLGSIPVGGLQELGGQQNAQTQTFDAFVNYFKNRYGSPQDLGNTVYKDPVGFLADLSTFFTGAGGAISAGGKLGDLAGIEGAANAASKAGEIANTAADLTNPLTPVIAGGKALATRASAGGAPFAAQGAGFLTGAGADAATSLFKASQEGGAAAEAARAALRGEISPNSIVDEAYSALKNLDQAQSSDYQAGLAALKGVKGSEDISPILSALDNQLGKFGITVGKDGLDFSRSTISSAADIAKVNGVYDTVKTWGSKAGDRTPIGLDTLKRRIGNFYNARTDGTPVGAFITPIKQSVRDVLGKVPGYDTTMKKFSSAQDLLDELEGTFSLSGKAKEDTVFRKLIGTLRSNDAFRVQMLKQLSEAGASNLEAKVAGASFAPYFARGLRGQLVEGAAVFSALQGLLTPKFLAVALATSPRIMGELIMALGGTAEQASKFTQVLSLLKQIAPPAAVQQESQKVLSSSDTSTGSTDQQTVENTAIPQ